MDLNILMKVQISDTSKSMRLLSEVFSGNFPASDVNKMNIASLEKFVLSLVEYTSRDVSAKNLSRIRCKDKPKWWPSDVLIEDCKSQDSIKQFRITLKQLIVNCCNFFKTYNVSWLPNTKSWVNDENFDIVRGVKRTEKDFYHNSLPSKKRKTLLSQNFTDDVSSECEKVCNDLSERKWYYFPEPPVDSDPVDQIGFLRLFDLGLNNNVVSQGNAPMFFRQMKFQNCPQIPVSSDAGMLMMKNENYSVPDFVTARKLDRVEWYVNKSIPKVSNLKYEISFVSPKYTSVHNYKFPKRQMRRNQAYNDFLFGLCKPLVVFVEIQDLIAKKKQLDSFKISVTIPQMPRQVLKRHMSKKCKSKNIKTTNVKPTISKFGRILKPLAN